MCIGLISYRPLLEFSFNYHPHTILLVVKDEASTSNNFFFLPLFFLSFSTTFSFIILLLFLPIAGKTENQVAYENAGSNRADASPDARGALSIYSREQLTDGWSIWEKIVWHTTYRPFETSFSPSRHCCGHSNLSSPFKRRLSPTAAEGIGRRRSRLCLSYFRSSTPSQSSWVACEPSGVAPYLVHCGAYASKFSTSYERS